MKLKDPVIMHSVIDWFEKAVLGLNLCPFAAAPYKQGAIEFRICHAEKDESCLTDLFLNLTLLDQNPDIETLVMICPNHLMQFTDYNQFLTLAENLLEQEGWGGKYQIASFHPDYRFADTQKDDRENWTNRSPFPLLHLIREASISRAVAASRCIDEIPESNIQTLRKLKEKDLVKIFGYRFQHKKIPE